MKTNHIDLAVLPSDIELPARPSRTHAGGRAISNTFFCSKADFGYMSERKFCGRYAISNRKANGLTYAERIATIISTTQPDKPTIRLVANGEKVNTTSPDGATWRTLELRSAYKSPDGKLVVIEIAPKSNKGAR